MSLPRFSRFGAGSALCLTGAALFVTSACAGLIGADFDRTENPDFGRAEAPSTGGEAGSGSSTGGTMAATGGMDGLGGEPLTPTDTTPPTIVSVAPSDDATGIGEEQHIVVEFSEPMDEGATAAAFRSEVLPAASVTFAWNDEGTVLTIVPNAPLPYAEGEADVDALTIAYFFDGARDLAGNELAHTQYSFTTLRRIVYVLLPAYDGAIKLLDGVYYTTPNNYAGGGGDPATEEFRTVVRFDITSLPGLADESRISARLEGAVSDVTGANALTDYGALSVGRISDASTAATRFESMSSEVPIGAMSKYGAYSIPVSSSFRADYVNRNELSNFVWYGFYFDGFEFGHIARAETTATLRVEYLEP